MSGGLRRAWSHRKVADPRAATPWGLGTESQQDREGQLLGSAWKDHSGEKIILTQLLPRPRPPSWEWTQGLFLGGGPGLSGSWGRGQPDPTLINPAADSHTPSPALPLPGAASVLSHSCVQGLRQPTSEPKEVPEYGLRGH